MFFEFNCPECSTVLEARQYMSFSCMKCPMCNSMISVPAFNSKKATRPPTFTWMEFEVLRPLKPIGKYDKVSVAMYACAFVALFSFLSFIWAYFLFEK